MELTIYIVAYVSAVILIIYIHKFRKRNND